MEGAHLVHRVKDLVQTWNNSKNAQSRHDQLVLLFTIAWSYRYLTTVQMSGTVVPLAAKTTSSDLIDELPVSLIDQFTTKKSRTRYNGQTYNPGSEGLSKKMRLGLQGTEQTCANLSPLEFHACA